MLATYPASDPIAWFTADEWRQMAARKSLAAFNHRMFTPFQMSDHIQLLIDALEWAVETPDARLIVTLPPRHSKSLNVSEHLPAWYLGNHPDERLICASHSQQLANTFSRRARNKFTDPRWPFPTVRIASDKGAVERWDIANHRGGYVAVGVGSTPVGEGGNIIIDDPLRSQSDAESETVRESIWEWYQGTLYTRLEPGGFIILTATRWHESDLTGRLLDAQEHGGEQWRHLHMPAISDDGHALWPSRWPLEALERIKTAVGTRVFTSQYQGAPVAAEGGTFKHDWWRTYTELPRLERIEITVDSAFKTGIANDYSVFAAWGADEYGNAYLLNVWRERVEFPDLIRLGYTAMQWAEQRFAPLIPLLVVEDQASGQSAIQTWRHPTNGDGISVTAFAIGGASKLARAEAITPFVEGGRVFIPAFAPWLDDWLHEHDTFPSGKHDDQVDTTAIGITRLLANRSGGWDAETHSDLAGWLAGVGV